MRGKRGRERREGKRERREGESSSEEDKKTKLIVKLITKINYKVLIKNQMVATATLYNIINYGRMVICEYWQNSYL